MKANLFEPSSIACLEAIRQLHAIGQLDDHFIPISDEEIVKQCNLIHEEHSESEIVELEFAFDRKRPKRLLFKKKINDYEYFKSLVKQSEGFDLYEIVFRSNDRGLDTGKQKLALLTKLNLNEEAVSIEIRIHFNVATFELLKREVKLDANELSVVDEFTRSVYRMAVPLFAMDGVQEELSFDSQRCLFKFVLIDSKRSIDFAQMSHASFEPNPQNADTDEKLVRPIHTDEHFKLLETSTRIFPADGYGYFSKKHISYNEFYRKKYGILIRDEEEDLIRVERSYSSVRQARRTGFRKSEYEYLPKELCVIWTMSDLLRKVSCLPRLIYEIKRSIILKHVCATLNCGILKINDETFKIPIFKRIPDGNIIDYIAKHFKDKQQVDEGGSNGTNSSDNVANEPDEDEDNEAFVRQINDAIDREFERSKESKKKSNVFTKNSRKFQEISTDMNNFYSSANPEKLDAFQHEILDAILAERGFENLDDFLQMCNFEKLFEDIVYKSVESDDLQDTDGSALLDDQTVEPIPESDELKHLDFNAWTNDTSDQQIVDSQLLKKALTMDDAEEMIDRERLEFLGDAFLKFVTCSLLFHLHRDAPVGNLDILKTNAVNNKNLYLIARRHEIWQVFFFGRFVPGLSWLPDGFSRRPDLVPFGRYNTNENTVTLVDSDGFRLAEYRSVDLCHYDHLKPKCLSDGIEALIGKLQ